MFQPLSVKRCPVVRLTLVSFLPGASRRCPTLSRARTHEPARADILLMPVRMSAFGAPPAGPELRAARAEEERGLRSELGQARRAASRAQQRLASCSSEAAVALHSAAALAAKRSCEVEQLRAAHSRNEVDQRRATARMDAAGSLVAASEQLNYVVREYAAAAASPTRRQPPPTSPTRCCAHATLATPSPLRVPSTGRWDQSLLCSRLGGWRRPSRRGRATYSLRIHCSYTAHTLHIHCIYTAYTLHGGRAGETVLLVLHLIVLRRPPLAWLQPLALLHPLPGYIPLPRHTAPYVATLPHVATLPYQLLTMVASYKLLGEQLWTTQEQA